MRRDERNRRPHDPGVPADLLLAWLEALPAGPALDIACGTGANALAIAAELVSRGQKPTPLVIGVDVSPATLKTAQTAARRRSLPATFFAADLTCYPLPRAYFDAVSVFRYLDRALVPRLLETLKPGGWLIYQTFTIGQIELGYGPRAAEHLLQPDELRQMFAGWPMLHYDEGICVLAGRPAAVASLVARRP